MTRLTPRMISDMKARLRALDVQLVSSVGVGLRGLAWRSVGLDLNISFERAPLVTVVPVSSGEGRIDGFAESLSEIASYLKLRARISSFTDVAGIRDAYEARSDIIMMADDEAFIAFDTNERKLADNSFCTANAYVTALEMAAGTLAGKKVLVVGAGRVGKLGIGMLLNRGANVIVVENDPVAYRWAARERKLETYLMVEEGLRHTDIVLNASPVSIPGDLVKIGTVLANPGVPFEPDDECLRRCRAIVHDPIAIGASAMIAQLIAGRNMASSTR